MALKYAGTTSSGPLYRIAHAPVDLPVGVAEHGGEGGLGLVDSGAIQPSSRAQNPFSKNSFPCCHPRRVFGTGAPSVLPWPADLSAPFSIRISFPAHQTPGLRRG